MSLTIPPDYRSSILKSFHHWCRNPDRQTLVMGILNVTPDSFYDGGQCIENQKAIGQAEKMIEDGGNDFIELGPGKVLQGLVRKINGDVEASSISS